MSTAFVAVAVATLAYFAVLNGVYLVFTAIAWKDLHRHARRARHAPTEEMFTSPLTPGISVLVPAYDEEVVIVETVRSLLALRYPRHQVVVVNDGSTDATLERLRDAFDLAPVRKALRGAIPTAPVRAAYVSRRNPRLWVVDKVNGGKADALNCGLSAADYPYVAAVDADALIEEGALLRVAQPIVDDPGVVAATGGIVRIVNGCLVDHGRVTDVRLPQSRLATLQVVEYLRAFLIGRVGWSRLNALLIISGAFGLFRRSLVEEVGGWWTDTVGEDVELVVRLHRHLRTQGGDYRIEFVSDPVCWTEAPEDLRTLSRQRRRWHRGLAEALRRHRGAICNPRYGTFGLVALPYFLFFELLGPVLGAFGLPLTLLAWALGYLSPLFLVAFLLVSILLGILLSISALGLEELGLRRQPGGRELARLVAYAALENVGYRQLNDFWRVLALVDLARGRRSWGAQRRRGFRVGSPA